MEEHEIELEVTNLMQELQKVSKEIENAISPYMDAIEASNVIIEENLKKQEEASAPYGKKSVEIQERIKELVLLRGKTLKTGSGTVTYRGGKAKIVWDTDSLEKDCEMDESIREKVWKYRSENPPKPSVTIKVDTKGTSVTDI